jgi:hypothetical protein
LDEAYVLCVFSDEWRQPENRSAFWRQNDSAQTCPKFFLSLAQLLVDIANGERRHSPSNEDKQIWFDMLADEVRRNDKNKLMHKYWKAIENCLLYSAHDKNERNRNPDEKQRAQEIIKEHIVRYLQDNLDVWERHTLGPNDDSQSSEERSPYHLQVQGSETRNLRRIATRQHPGYPRQPAGHNWQSRQSVEPEFTLWSTEEDDWEILYVNLWP